MSHQVRQRRRRGRPERVIVALLVWLLLTAVFETTAVAAAAPGVPGVPSAVAGNARATLRWQAPAANGAPITAYVVTPYIGTKVRPSRTFKSAATSAIFAGLANATTYTFRIAAKNANGTGRRSVPTNAVTVGAPGLPMAASAEHGNARATLRWTAPATNGAPIAAYVITPYVGATARPSRTFKSAATTAIVTGLANATTYTFRIAARNANGTGRRSFPTNAVTLGVPGVPTAPSAEAGNAEATVRWTAPSENGAPITAYVITPYIGTAAQTSIVVAAATTFTIVTGLSNSTPYTFRIAATNANGTGRPCVATNAVTPMGISFGRSLLAGTSSTYPTVARFGPDRRLYVGQFDGLIKAYSIVRNGINAYAVTSTETIDLVQQIPNHDDDGTPNPSVSTRLVSGLAVAGSATSPILYVSSSDPRVGDAQAVPTNLDTNSGVVSRLTRDTNGWHRKDVVRGLPRSEENHATNALVLDRAANSLYVAQGGNTNMGAPSHNFGELPEYAYSGAILEVDLNAIGTTTYDLPTLVDEDHPDLVGPFGGNRGKRQAKITPSSPVQVFAPGFRNAFSLVRSRAGRLYAWDNGSNAGWGDVPVGTGPAGQCSNAVNEPGVDQSDSLHLIGGQGYYAGHANPTRGNMANTFNATNPQAAVPAANPIECDARTTATNGAIASLPTPTTGMAEYTTTNLVGQLDGDLITAGWYGTIYRVRLSEDGSSVTSTDPLFSNVGPLPVDVAVQGDSEAYPGTIWVPNFGDGAINVFEPDDFAGRAVAACRGADSAILDEDHDGYANADEIDNGTGPCSAADKPHDWNDNFVSDRNDPNDDSDGLLDASDPFAIDPHNGLNTDIPLNYSWQNGATSNPCAPTPFPSGCPGGLLGLGFTGLMSNGQTRYDALYDANNMTAGGAAGVLTVSSVPSGDATGSANNQLYAFQYGVNANPADTGTFTVHSRVDAPFAGLSPQGNQSMGLYIGTGDQDNYAKVILTANNGSPGVQFVKEIAGTSTAGPVSALPLPGPAAVDLYLTIDPSAGTVAVSYRVTTNNVLGPTTSLGTQSIPAAWCTGATSGLAIGIIATSTGGPTLPATWSILETTAGIPPS